jgi:hypothetical protein
MFFRPIISRWGDVRLAKALALPVKNVRSWIAQDSIPGGWYARVAETGIATLVELASAGTAREMYAEAKRAEAKRASEQARAA